MERIKEENLGSVVARFLKETGLQTQLNQYRLKQAWPIITGELVKSKTQDLYIKNQKNSKLQLGSILTTTRFIFFLNTGYINASR